MKLAYLSNTVRVVEIDGQPWFVAMDLPVTLGFTYDNLRYHLRVTLTEDERMVVKLPGIRGNGLVAVAESGLYKLIMRSDKPEAREFQDWVTREVLPAIRKDGMYVTGEEKVKTGQRIGARQANYFHRGNKSTEARCMRLCHCPEFSGEWSPPRSREAESSDGMRPKSSIAPRKCNET